MNKTSLKEVGLVDFMEPLFVLVVYCTANLAYKATRSGRWQASTCLSWARCAPHHQLGMPSLVAKISECNYIFIKI